MNTTLTSPFPYTYSRPRFHDNAKKVAGNFGKYASKYVKSIFPVKDWIAYYNMRWLVHDIISGLTVGIVAIPQSIGYARVAGLPPEYGLYSSFVGVLLYWLFATSKDISIGPTAVLSLLIGQISDQIYQSMDGQYTKSQIAITINFCAGILSLAIGLLRLGVIVDYIPGPVIVGFTTGSALTIATTELPRLFGMMDIEGESESSFEIQEEAIQELSHTHIDAVVGFICLFYLYALKYISNWLGKRYPRYERLFFFVGLSRNITLLLCSSIFASMIYQRETNKSPIAIVGAIPSGLDHFGLAKMDLKLLLKVSTSLPVVVLMLVLEHVAVAKSFGRINNYKIDASQEIIAIGIINTIGSFFGAFPTAGAFSKSAIKAKAGVHTPIAGVFTGTLVVLALFWLTPGFFFIPDAAIAAVLIHAVFDVVCKPSYVYTLYKIEFTDFIVFITAVIFSAFFNVEISVYISTLLALFFIIYRLARPRVDALSRLAITSDSCNKCIDCCSPKYAYVPNCDPSFTASIEPPNGVLIFRLDESLTYPNASFIEDTIFNYVKKHTRRYHKRPEKKYDRKWNDMGPKYKDEDEENSIFPRLRALILDIAAVSFIDATGLQALTDLKKAINKYSDHNVEYHFANIANKKVQDTLIIGGFGTIELDPKSENQKRLDEEAPTEIPDKLIQKQFFHLTLDTAVAATTENTEWPQPQIDQFINIALSTSPILPEIKRDSFTPVFLPNSF
ncbi:hypothetical protein G9A89_021112 [Geosiphon pyriformis]|nr:hypothetical protein G9A89_021112 [Geosiphon pyriformis]